MPKMMTMAMVSAMLLAQPAFAAMDCGASLDQHTSMIMKMSQASPEKRAALQRMALRGYDHCVAGDEVNAKALFSMVMSTASSK